MTMSHSTFYTITTRKTQPRVVAHAGRGDSSSGPEEESGRGVNPNEEMYKLDFKLDGGTSALLVFAFVAFQFFVLAFVQFPTMSQLKGM
eukprot:CAMPEP_0196594006 /NCGR_PEP_ID=MMETSP1081-20130531/77124_1 /TAXON_ID=36882 /ORGANISM="Pyramimonas amylifera, Strain CCMP720" /LENGTH=88 /DNA_ID=CAMNT_0041918149 /DNA_START=46 /DNA_END=312 /DNA_ORIENTATION=-